MKNYFTPKILDFELAHYMADLNLIQLDFQHLKECLDYIIEKKLESLNTLEAKALFDSFCVRYRRCFKTGKRKHIFQISEKIGKDITLSPTQQITHDYILSLTDKHIAHSVCDLEYAVTTIFIDSTKNPISRGGVGKRSTKIIQNIQFKEIEKLVNYISKNLIILESEINLKIKIMISNMSDKELISLKCGLDDNEIRKLYIGRKFISIS